MTQKLQPMLHYSKIFHVNHCIDIIINTIAWWIPVKKLREKFRNKFR
ncbi:hypothetical protein [Brachyspira pilosicoli]|nr:hypothetical protein [Brachyspira pilosicoli]